MSLMERFLDALRTFDDEAMAELLAPDAVLWRNIGNKERTPQEVLEMLRVERALIPSSTLRIRHQSPTADGFVVQLVLEGTTRGGADFAIPICIVARVADGRVAGFDEYSDETSLRPLWEEFAASQPAP